MHYRAFRAASLLFESAARLRASRRQRARAREHAWPRSTAAWRSAPTAWSWTSISPATAWSWCITTATLDRTTNLHGRVADRTARELARADAGYAFAPGDGFPFRGRAVGVPALGDVLRGYRDVPIIVELKVNTAAMAQAVVSVVRAAGCGRSRLPRVVRTDGAPRGARPRAVDRDERGARRGPLGAVSIVVSLAGDARRVRRVSGAGMGGPHAGGVAAVRRGRPSRRAWRPGVDGRYRSRRDATVGLGR